MIVCQPGLFCVSFGIKLEDMSCYIFVSSRRKFLPLQLPKLLQTLQWQQWNPSKLIFKISFCDGTRSNISTFNYFLQFLNKTEVLEYSHPFIEKFSLGKFYYQLHCLSELTFLTPLLMGLRVSTKWKDIKILSV